MADRPGSPLNRTGCVLGSLILLMGASLLVPLGPSAAAQTNDTTSSGPLSLGVSSTSYAAGEPVVLRLWNNGSQRLEGDVHVTLWWHCSEVRDVCTQDHMPVATLQRSGVSLAVGEFIRFSWDQTSDDGKQVPGGPYHAEAEFTTTSGPTTTAKSSTFKLERSPGSPTISIQDPSSTSRYAPGSVPIAVTIEDPDGLDRVGLRVSGQTLVDETVAGETTWSYQGETPPLDDGFHKLWVGAVDTTGAESMRSLTFEVAVDTGNASDPTIRFETPRFGETVPAGDVPVKVHFNAPDGLAYIRLELDNRTINEEAGFQTVEPGITSYTHERTHQLARGEHRLEATVRDTDGDEDRRVILFRAGASTGGQGHLAVRLDTHQFGRGDPVRIHLTNEGSGALEGTPRLQVRDGHGQVVWSPATIQVLQRLGPGESQTYTWNQTTDAGRQASAGPYVVTASWGESTARNVFEIRGEAGAFHVQILRPQPGSGHSGAVPIQLRISDPGATSLSIVVADGDAAFDRQQRFETPVTGTFERRVDLGGASQGFYKVHVQAEGPGGKAQASTWFRLTPQQDTSQPSVELLHPGEGAQVPRVFPLVFQVEDDTGATYAEAYLDGELVGRHAWPHPVPRGAFPVRLPADATGEQEVRLVIYDAGRNRASATVTLDVLGQAPPCSQVLTEARVLVNASMVAPTSRMDPNRSIVANATASTGASFVCPPEHRPPPRDQVDRGSFRYARDDGGSVVDVHVRDRPVFDRIAAEGGEDRPARELRLDTRGRFLVLDADARANLTADLNGTWVATQRGQHVILENTEDGTRILVAIQGASPAVLGQRLVAQVDPGARLIVRPMGQGDAEGALVDGIVNGRVGAEVAVDSNQADPEAVSYGELNVTVSNQGHRLAATLSSQQHEGRTLVFTLGQASELSQAGGFNVLLDGQELEQAASLEDVLDQPDPTKPSEYFVVQADGETKVIVQVNHFSTRELVIQAAAAVAPFLTPIAVFGGLTVVGIATFALFRREEM